MRLGSRTRRRVLGTVRRDGSGVRLPAAGAAVVLVLAVLAPLLSVVVTAPTAAAPPTPTAPFAAIQWGTNGCIEVGVRPDAPYNQPRPRVAPAGSDLLAGYPVFGYDTSGYAQTNGTNACRYNFRDTTGSTTPIASGYCVQWARGQRTGTGYDPLPWDGSIANDGYVRRILAENWPAAPLPTVASTNATVINRQRSGAVAMAIHYFTDRIVMPPDYQDPAIYAAVADVVNRALAAGPLAAPTDPRPTVSGPVSGLAGELVGPYVVGADADGDITVTIAGGAAFIDAGGSQPFTSGSSVSPGTQLWVRATDPGSIELEARAEVADPVGTLMVGDPAFPVQSMALATPVALLGKATLVVRINSPPLTPAATSQVSAHLLQAGRSVVDTFVITGLGPTGAATLAVTLRGPVPAPAGGCGLVAWADPGLPVARTFPPASVVGDQVVHTDPTPLETPGCYSFGAVITPASGPTFTMPPGDPAETLRVAPAAFILPWLVTSRVSDGRIRIGDRVRDQIRIRSLDPDRRLTITPVLLGPVSPAAGGCRDVDWTQARPRLAVRFPTVQQTGSGTIVTPYARPTRPGCYSFAARVTNGFQTGGLVVAPHGYGHPRELVQVLRAAPTVRTRTSDDRVSPGQRVHDRVRVKGLAVGTSVPAIARLYGPFSSHAGVRCRPANQAAAVTWRVRNGLSRSPSVEVSRPGFYTWRVATRATPANRAARHACAQPAEGFLVAKPRYPAPLVNGGYSGDLLGYPRSRQPGPVIRGAAFGLRAPVLTTGLRDGEMALPADVGSVAWLRRSASFRDKIGITVIAGHVSDRRDRPGALWGLSRASPGQTVTIGSGATTRRYEVTDTATFARTSRLPRQYFRTAGRHRLVLISCTGRVVYDNGHFHYTRYQIVVAKRIGSHSRP